MNKHFVFIYKNRTSANGFATVFNWINENKRGRASTADKRRSCNLKMIDKIHHMVLSN